MRCLVSHQCLVISESPPDADLDAFRPLATLMAALRESGTPGQHLVQFLKYNLNINTKVSSVLPAGKCWDPEDETMHRIVDSSCSHWYLGIFFFIMGPTLYRCPFSLFAQRYWLTRKWAIPNNKLENFNVFERGFITRSFKRKCLSCGDRQYILWTISLPYSCTTTCRHAVWNFFVSNLTRH